VGTLARLPQLEVLKTHVAHRRIKIERVNRPYLTATEATRPSRRLAHSVIVDLIVDFEMVNISRTHAARVYILVNRSDVVGLAFVSCRRRELYHHTHRKTKMR
jgi:hypothetical protein